jgi:predicted small integral membrane protein
MTERLGKIALVGAVALFMALVSFNNLVDYGSNFDFVKHVLSMDTTFPGNRLKWRAIGSPVVHHAFYAGIIAWEIASTAGLVAGTWRLWAMRASSSSCFHAAKGLAAGALAFNLLLWFVAFITVGGEWFVMWQSQVWNGQTAAFRMFACVGIVLLYLKTPDPEVASP